MNPEADFSERGKEKCMQSSGGEFDPSRRIEIVEYLVSGLFQGFKCRILGEIMEVAVLFAVLQDRFFAEHGLHT